MLKYLCTMTISKSSQGYWDKINNTPSWKPPPLKDTVGLAIITCNREEFLKKVLASIPRHKINYLCIINDGDSPDFEDKSDHGPRRFVYSKNGLCGNYFYTGGGRGVGFAKNWAFKELLKKGHSQELANWPGDKCGIDHLFIMEDDIIIKDENVFEKYIETSKQTGLKHLMYGYHGPANKAGCKSKGAPQPRKIIDYGNDVSVALNRHCVGAFTYYHRSVIKDVGINDNFYVNAWEHVDHSFQIVKKGYLPAYWWWPDVAKSYDYLDELACSEDNSVIRPRQDWYDNVNRGAEYFYNKHGSLPGMVPDTKANEVIAKLKQIKQNV
mgnify:CR=1 FL=1